MQPPVETQAAEPPVIAVFHSDAAAEAAVEAAGAEVLRNPSPGVLFLRPSPGLAARLYAAGAGVVVS